MQIVLRLWLLATALFVGSAMVWSFAPVLVPVLGLTVAIGLLAAAIVGFARWIERKRGRPTDI